MFDSKWNLLWKFTKVKNLMEKLGFTLEKKYVTMYDDVKFSKDQLENNECVESYGWIN